MMYLYRFLFVTLLALLTSCSTQKTANISYISNTSKFKVDASPKLNVYSSRSTTKLQPVLIFIYGGNWDSGSKGLYNFFGRHFAAKNVVTVIPNYTKSPKANYDDMAHQIAEAITWTKANIEMYGGDPKRIFITGHSAGGHLAALSVMNPDYGIASNTIKGIILNDAAGLDMYTYLKNNPPTTENNYITTWTKIPNVWKEASSIYYIDENTPPVKLYLGKRTLASIKASNRRFIEALDDVQLGVEPIILNKTHSGMMLQYLLPWSDRYSEIITFINSIN